MDPHDIVPLGGILLGVGTVIAAFVGRAHVRRVRAAEERRVATGE